MHDRYRNRKSHIARSHKASVDKIKRTQYRASRKRHEKQQSGRHRYRDTCKRIHYRGETIAYAYWTHLKDVVEQSLKGGTNNEKMRRSQHHIIQSGYEFLPRLSGLLDVIESEVNGSEEKPADGDDSDDAAGTAYRLM